MIALRQVLAGLKPRPLRARRGAIGVDLSLDSLHMVQLSKRPDGNIALSARASLAYPCSRDELLRSPTELKRLVASALKQGGFDGRRAVLGMPAGRFRTMPVNYRPRSGMSDDQVIAGLMAERLDGSLADYVIDYIPVRAQARDAEKLAIVACSRRDEVVSFLDAMRGSGLAIDALEIGPVAIRRLANALPSSSSQMILIVNTGRDASYLTMLSGRRLLLDQSIEFSESRVLAALVDALDIEEESARDMILRTGLHPKSGRTLSGHREGETGIFNTLLEIIKPELSKLIEETDRAFMYAAAQTRGGGDASIWLLGALARWPGADHVLSELTHLPVTTLPNPLRAFGDDGDGMVSAEPEFAVASGLALRGLCDDE